MLDRAALQHGLSTLTPHADAAPIQRVVARLPGEERRLLDEGTLDLERGLVGDKWAHCKRNRATQITLMRYDVAALMTEGAEVAILGDNLFASLDTSEANLPTGTRVQAGTAILAVTAKPHNGCKKFAARVGEDAWAITGDPAWTETRLRGVHLEILTPGVVRPGDLLRVLERPTRA